MNNNLSLWDYLILTSIVAVAAFLFGLSVGAQAGKRAAAEEWSSDAPLEVCEARLEDCLIRETASCTPVITEVEAPDALR